MLKDILIAFIDAYQESNARITLEKEICLKRAMIKYLVVELDKCANVSIDRGPIIVYMVFLFICIYILSSNDIDESNKLLITVINVPIIIEGMIRYKTDKLEAYNKIQNIEMQLFEMCVFIKINDRLEENEEYILKYLKSKKKYTIKNEFDVIKAKGG